jgi:c-di-GMP-binding flagellar brake protein YcgR
MKLLQQLTTLFSKNNKPSKVAKRQVEAQIHYISNILEQLRNQKCSLTIQFYCSKTPFVSTVLYLDPAKQFILLDQINHSAGDLLAKKGERFIVKVQCGEDHVIFESKVDSIQTLHGSHCYRLAYPNTIAHSKRRASPRFILSENKKADLFIAHFPHIKTTIRDISLVGISFSIPRHLRNVLHSLARENECRLLFQSLPTHSFIVEMKNYRFDFDKQQLTLGCEFKNLDNIRLKFLAKMLTSLNS